MRIAVSSLMEKYDISYEAIGRLEVGTESNPDRAKSIKSFLMTLFAASGNKNVSGTDCVNACFGGTAALMNSVNWMESREWDGRCALVVATDVAVYGKGAARPTGGAGAVALLIGPNAPIVVERGISFSYMDHTFDFYKPDPASEYPVVDGPISIATYTSALRECTMGLVQKIEKQTGELIRPLMFFNFLLFHSPYGKLVRKAFAELLHLDCNQAARQEYSAADCNGDRTNSGLRSPAVVISPASFETMVKPGLAASKVLGNLYCASVFANLISLIQEVSDENLLGKRVGVFSFGSGCASMLYSLRIQGSVGEMRHNINLMHRLDDRHKISPAVFEQIMDIREERFLQSDWTPTGTKLHNPGQYSLQGVDNKFRRYYQQA
jgi:hydroxymethylglutaryl-CoA synthase